MKLLLDTQAFLWWQADDRRLGGEAREAIASAELCVVSAASAWEVAIKQRLGKIRIPEPFETAVERAGMSELPITFRHASGVAELPDHHADPFDRMLVAQAAVEGLTLVTHDRRFEPYRIPVIWT